MYVFILIIVKNTALYLACQSYKDMILKAEQSLTSQYNSVLYLKTECMKTKK